jgi:hypothetical protein
MGVKSCFFSSRAFTMVLYASGLFLGVLETMLTVLVYPVNCWYGTTLESREIFPWNLTQSWRYFSFRLDRTSINITTSIRFCVLSRCIIVFFICNWNQQSEFTFYKLMLWLLQRLEGESSSGESPVPQVRSIGQFLLSRLFSSLNSSVLRSGFSWVSSLVWYLLHFWWMTSCTYDMPSSACSVALETYHGASTIILRILDWFLWIIDILDLLAQPHNSRPYVLWTSS